MSCKLYALPLVYLRLRCEIVKKKEWSCPLTNTKYVANQNEHIIVARCPAFNGTVPHCDIPFRVPHALGKYKQMSRIFNNFPNTFIFFVFLVKTCKQMISQHQIGKLIDKFNKNGSISHYSRWNHYKDVFSTYEMRNYCIALILNRMLLLLVFSFDCQRSVEMSHGKKRYGAVWPAVWPGDRRG